MKAVFFKDGNAERLHGHNYQVKVACSGEELRLGLLAPFHDLKREVVQLCQAWDEYVLLPAQCPWATYQRTGQQLELHLKTPLLEKHYSFPAEDVILLATDNISCERLAELFAQALASRLRLVAPSIRQLEIALSESPSQWVELSLDLQS
jgi:6-pyruvoyltetrahydropterin/6-carboxytetrahydropterin synthase